MFKPKTSSAYALALALTFACLGAPLPVGGLSAAAQDKDQGRDLVAQLYEQGNEMLRQERANSDDTGLRRRRVEAFRAAAAAQNDYVARWVTDRQSLEYVVERYRLGLYLELANSFERALKFYELCLLQPRVRDAIWDSQPLKPQIEERLRQLTLLAGNGGGRRTRETITITEHMKGMIFLVGVSVSKVPEKLSEQDAQTVAARLTFTSDPQVALAGGRELLRANGALQPITEANDGNVVVFGIHDREGGATRLAGRLSSARRTLARVYFDAGPTQPVITVYANFESDCHDTLGHLTPTPALSRPAIPSPPATSAWSSGLVRAGSFFDQQQRQMPAPARDPSAQSAEQQSPLKGRDNDKKHVSAGPDCVELVAQDLSRTLHFRKMEDAEGYFEPLDDSVVVRKGLTWGRSFFFGTATHELTHALVHLDFPQAPIWIDEGLAAMHEEYRESGNAAPPDPLDNYRLYYLRFALDSGKFPALEALINPDSAAWRNEAQPVMAAAARYFCIYLLKKESGQNMLKRTYDELRDGPQGEPSKDASARALEHVTGQKIAALEADFKKFVMGRDLDVIGPNWGRLSSNISLYVSKLPSSAIK